jgi:hypothetical protein
MASPRPLPSTSISTSAMPYLTTAILPDRSCSRNVGGTWSNDPPGPSGTPKNAAAAFANRTKDGAAGPIIGPEPGPLFGNCDVRLYMTCGHGNSSKL